MIQTEHTPNPDTLKFLPGKKVSEIGPLEFLKDDKSIKVPLANKILSLEGTVMVFFGEDFITVKKEKNLNWKDLKHGIISEIITCFRSLQFRFFSFFTVIKSSPKNTIRVPFKDKILFAKPTVIFLSPFKNSIGPASETFFPGKNFRVSGFGVFSVSIIIINICYRI